mmetsp:Transcript_13535/g.32262  ORF Transcript_13535/g.32262 Transcript_13535/m.32262 type:complete len:81 (-) Transcript_13535:380-622(-)
MGRRNVAPSGAKSKHTDDENVNFDEGGGCTPSGIESVAAVSGLVSPVGHPKAGIVTDIRPQKPEIGPKFMAWPVEAGSEV